MVLPSACPWVCQGPTLGRLALDAPGLGLAPADGASERPTVRAREGKRVVEWCRVRCGFGRMGPGPPGTSRFFGLADVQHNSQSGVWPRSRPAHGRGTGRRSWLRSAVVAPVGHPVVAAVGASGRGSRSAIRSWLRSAIRSWLRSALGPRWSRPNPTSYRSQPDRDRLPLIRPGLCGRLHRSPGGEAGVGCSDSRRRTAPHRGRGSSQRCCRQPPDSPAGFRQS